MIALWLLYAALLAGCLAVGGAAASRAHLALGHPTRFAWAAALLLATLLPAALVTRAAIVSAPVPDAAPAVVLTEPIAITAAPTAAFASIGDTLAALDIPLLALWAGASLCMLLALTRAALLLARRRRRWRTAVVDGVPVLVAAEMGPAVVGVHRPRIVLPAWALELDAGLRALVLRHEREHVRAGDPLLLLLATLALALQPLNPVMWWLHRRLRLAVELDCDRRVLAATGDARRYGLLLIAVGQRRSAMPPALAPALAEPATFLARRIAAMRQPSARRPLLAGAAGALALVALVVACAAPAPDRVLSEEGEPEARAVAAPPSAPARVVGEPYFEFQVEEPVTQLSGGAPRYPAALREQRVSGEVIGQFVVDTAGNPEPSTFKVIRSSHALFTEAVRTALPDMRFEPARVGGRAVKQLVQQPFVFAIASGTATPGKAVRPQLPARPTSPKSPTSSIP